MARAVKAEKATSDDLLKAEADLAAKRQELADLMIQSGLDVAGVFDPTPTSDLISAGYSLARGDVGGAALSLVSCVPYIGDVIAKPLKGTKLAKAIGRAAARADEMLAYVDRLKAVRKKAADEVRAARDAAKRAKQDELIEPCPKTNPFGTKVPRSGTWSGQRGDSDWMPGDNTTNRALILKETGGKPIRYKDGYPDLSPYSEKTVSINMTGNDYTDFKRANAAAGYENTPEGFTWHHHQDGHTMQLVPEDLHGNVPHTGGASIVADKEY